MAERSMDEIMGALDHLLDDFDHIPRLSLAKYRAYPADVLVEHSVRAAATCVYDHMVSEGDRRLLIRLGIRPLEIRGLKLWLIDDHSVVRLKKMDEDGKSRNYPTKQAKDFDRGAELPGLPPLPTRLTVGYLPDPTGTQVVRVQVARPLGRGIMWCAAIVPTADRKEGEKGWIDVTRQRRFGP